MWVPGGIVGSVVYWQVPGTMVCLYGPVFCVEWLLWGCNCGGRDGDKGESSGRACATAET